MNKAFKLWDDCLTIFVCIPQINVLQIRQLFVFKKRVSAKEQIIFFKRLAMMLRARLPITESLEIIAAEQAQKNFNQIVRQVLNAVSSGQTLAFALGQQQKIFNSFSLSIIKIGENSGTLADNLEYLAIELKKKQEIKKQIIGSLIYPIIVVVATLFITVFLIVSIFPKIVPIFLSVKTTLPWSTRFLIVVSDFLISYGWYVFSLFVVLCVTVPFLLRIPKIHYFATAVSLRLPIVGQLSQCYNLSQVSRTMSLLLNSGVPIITAFEITTKSTSNVVYRKAFENIQKEIITGKSIASELQKSPHLFPAVVVQMIQAGEKTGNVSMTLAYLSEIYETEIKDTTKNLTTILEPVLMLFMGLLVGFIAISIIAPIYGITQNL